MSLIKEPPPGVRVDADSVSQNLTQWIINIDGVDGTLYEGEHFQLLFKFNHKYPFDSPEVSFYIDFFIVLPRNVLSAFWLFKRRCIFFLGF